MNKTSLIRTVVSTWQATQHLHSSHRGPCQGAAFPKLQSRFSVSLCFPNIHCIPSTLLSRAQIPQGQTMRQLQLSQGPQFPLCSGSVFPQGLAYSASSGVNVYATHRATQWVSRRNLGPPSIRGCTICCPKVSSALLLVS